MGNGQDLKLKNLSKGVIFYKSFVHSVLLKPVFGVSEKVRFKPACSAIETSKKIETSRVAILDMIISITQIKKALIRLRRCTGWSAPLLFANPKTGFLASWPIW